MGIRPRKSSSRGPGALIGRLALSGRDRLYRPRVACRGACPHAQAEWCRGACPHAQAEWCRGACPDAQPRAQELRLHTPPLHPEIAAEDRPPLHLRSRHSIGPIALPRRVATALRRRAARRATPTERPHSEGGYNLSVSQREFEQFHLDMAKTPACRKALLAPGPCAHIPISASSFRGCATDDRKSLLASAAWRFQAVPISCQSRCAAIEPTWARRPHLLARRQKGARDRA